MKLREELHEASKHENDDVTSQAEFEMLKGDIIARLEFILSEYRCQYDGIAIRTGKRKSEMLVSIVTFVSVFLLDGVLTIMIHMPEGSILALAWEIWAACVILFIALCKTAKNMILNIFSYCVHTERRGFMRYIRKYEIFTLEEEKRYCADKITELEQMIQEMHELESGKPDSKYMEYEYVEKRSDVHVLDFFDNNRALLIIGMIIAIIIIYFL